MGKIGKFSKIWGKSVKLSGAKVKIKKNREMRSVLEFQKVPM